jgi:putative aldouronate transport system substrate-binding protein
MYSGPGTLPDTKMVVDAFNEELGKLMPGVKADIEFVLNSSYEEKLRLLLSANEELDVANMNSGAGEATNSLITESKKGAMMPLDDLLAKKPEFFDLIPDNLWEMSKVSGTTYMVPVNKSITDKYIGIKLHKDLIEKYGDLAALKNSLENDNGRVKAETYDLLTSYLANLKAAGEIRHGVGVATMRWLPQRGYYSLYKDWSFAIDKSDGTSKVLNYFEQPDVKMMYQYHHDWFNAGYIDKDILSVEDRRFWERKEDGTVMCMTTQFVTDPSYEGVQWDTDAANTTDYGYPVSTVAWEKNIYIVPMGNALQGLIIPRTSKHPEEALEYIWHTNSNIDLWHILSAGIEGVHYQRNENGDIDAFIKEADQARYRGEGWNIGNTLLPDPISLGGHDWIDYTNNVVMGSMAILTPLASFQLDIEPIKNELDQFDAVRAEYEASLFCGAVDNWEARYDEMIAKMKEIGSDKIIAEIQKQVDAFLASK